MTNAPPRGRGPILFISTSLFTDRMLAYSGVLDALPADSTVVWASSMSTEAGRQIWSESTVRARPVPQVDPLRFIPSLALRRIDERAWDRRLRPPSRVDPARDGLARPGAEFDWAYGPLGWMVARCGQHERFEDVVGRHLVKRCSSADGEAALRELSPSAVVVSNPFWGSSPDLGAIAIRLGIPTFALIPSWDNISTKRRMELPFDGYLVWSDRGERELREFYPNRSDRPVRQTGAVQFDVFFQERFEEPRERWAARHGFDPGRKVILYALASPNFLHEVPGALAMAERVRAGDLGEVTLLVRPHPIHDLGEMEKLFDGPGDRVIVQGCTGSADAKEARSQSADTVLDWVSTFRHSDVVVNLASTVTVDAAVCDTPVISLDYDPAPGGRLGPLIKEINRTWTHFSPVARSGGVRMVGDEDALLAAVRSYLDDPGQDAAGRARIVADVCGVADGSCGLRLAAALEDLINQAGVPR